MGWVGYFIDRENVQAIVLVKPRSARAIVSSFWIMGLIGRSGMIGPIS